MKFIIHRIVILTSRLVQARNLITSSRNLRSLPSSKHNLRSSQIVCLNQSNDLENTIRFLAVLIFLQMNWGWADPSHGTPDQAEQYKTSFFEALANNDQTTLNELIDSKKVDVNLTTLDGFPPLTVAVGSYPEVVEFLLKKGANPNQPTSNGWLPMDYAIPSGNHATVHHLVQYQANLQLRSANPASFAEAAAENNDHSLTDYLVSKGAPINYKNQAVIRSLVHEGTPVGHDYGRRINMEMKDAYLPQSYYDEAQKRNSNRLFKSCAESPDGRPLHPYCYALTSAESNRSCNVYEDPIQHDVCRSLTQVINAHSCEDQSSPSANWLKSCRAIEAGMKQGKCDGIEPKDLCDFGHYISRNRIIFLKKRDLAKQENELRPLLDESFQRVFQSGIQCGNTTPFNHLEELNTDLQTLLQTHLSAKSKIDHFVNNIMIRLEGMLNRETTNRQKMVLAISQLVKIVEQHKAQWGMPREEEAILPAGSDVEGETLPLTVVLRKSGKIDIKFDRFFDSNTSTLRPFNSLGKGATKTVWLAADYEQATKGSDDAIGESFLLAHADVLHDSYKHLVKKDEVFQDRFNRSSATASQGIVETGTFFDTKPNAGFVQRFYPMTLQSLRSLLSSPQFDSIQDQPPSLIVRKLAIDLLEGLNTIHSHGVRHRDIKPENVVISFDNQYRPHAHLTDFGISVEVSDKESLNNALGSDAYMSPELAKTFVSKQPRTVAEINADPASDLWALGLTLNHLNTGRSNGMRVIDAAMVNSYSDLNTHTKSHYDAQSPPQRDSMEYLIFRMLDPNPKTRATLEEALTIARQMVR